jgi:hypothetical protein
VFSVKEMDVFVNQKGPNPTTSGRFPGADPCASHKFENVTYTFYYDGTAETGPRSKVDGKTGAGKLLRVWQEQSGNMYIENYASSILPFACICVAPREATETAASGPVIGALEYDFAKDAVLIGRERIGVEYPTMHEVVADHWNKGPHHFWVEVATNLMVRGWQPYNGLNVWYDWDMTMPSEETFALQDGCKTTNPIVNPNVGGCLAPHPSKSP